MKYATAAAFRQALEERLKNEAASTGLALARRRTTKIATPALIL